MALGLGGCVAAVVAFNLFADDVADRALGGGPCPFLSADDASDVLGAGTTTIEARGLTQVLVIIDARVMADDRSCALTRDDADGGGGLGRVARYQGGDAAARYEAELTKARGVTEEVGEGLSVTSEEYFNKALADFGDEAFCTKSSGVGAGVLVREGTTLVYASVVVDVDASPGVDLSDPDNAKLGTDDLHCEVAQRLARRVLDA
jgi:hypothetical protein